MTSVASPRRKFITVPQSSAYWTLPSKDQRLIRVNDVNYEVLRPVGDDQVEVLFYDGASRPIVSITTKNCVTKPKVPMTSSRHRAIALRKYFRMKKM